MSHYALRFMDGFECIGPACEDSCCANWQVDVDREHFVKISRLLGRTPGGQEELTRAFVFPDEQTPGRYARMRLTDESHCPFWDREQMCSLQRRFTERLLPDVCAHFPRSLSIVDGKMELNGHLSCPEVTRRALADEHACDLVEVAEVAHTRGGVRQRTFLDNEDPYYARFLEVRETLQSILNLKQYPMRSRLFFALCFADRTAPFFHRGTTVFVAVRWDEERRNMSDPLLLEEMHAELEKARLPDGLALFVIAQVLSGDVQLRAGGRLRQTVTEVLESFGLDFGGREVSATELWAAYLPRRQGRMADSGARIDQIFENYCRQFWLRDWYVDSTDMFQHVQSLLVRVAVLRFLLISHPGSAQAATLDATAVTVVSGMTRGIEHHSEFLKLITEGLRSTLPTLWHAASLLFV